MKKKGGVNMQINIRQGDIRLKSITRIPTGAKVLKDKILAYGEVTGHTHRFLEPKNIDRYEDAGKTYLRVRVATPLVHEEHNTLIIPVGDYEQIQEREYDYPNDDIRAVVD